MIPLPSVDGVLDKVKIIPFENPETFQMGFPIGPPFIAQFNPESFSIDTQYDWGPEETTHGDKGGEAKFKSVNQRTFSMDFLLDGTGASGFPMEVKVGLKLFEATVQFSGNLHRPNYLVVHWGLFLVTCVLESYTVNYKLFRPDGSPLRAVISASFKEHIANEKNELIKNLLSPDLTHFHSVNDGEHLTWLSQKTYKNPNYYYQIAESNNLNNLRQLKTGQELLLYPIADK